MAALPGGQRRRLATEGKKGSVHESTEDTGDDSESYTGDDAAADYDVTKISLPRTSFKKRGSFGRYKDVWLELDGVTLKEFTGSQVAKPSWTRKFSGGCRVLDGGSLIGDVNTILLIPDSKNGKASRAFYKATDKDTYEVWLKAIRRAVGHQAIKAGIQHTGLDVNLFDDPTLISNIDGTLVQVNEAAAQLFGWSIAELVGKPIKVILPPAVAKHHDEYMSRFEKTGNKRLIGKPRVMKALHRDGSLIKVMVSLGEVGEGATKMYVGTMRDVRNDAEFASGGSQSQEDGQRGDSSIDKAIDQSAEALKREISRVLSSMGSNTGVLQEKLADKTQKYNQAKAQLEELDLEAQRLQLSAKIARRALDMLIVTEADDTVALEKASAPKEDSDEKLMDTIKQEIDAEIVRASASSATTLFRADDFRTRKISAFMLVVGAKYLSDTLGPSILVVRSTIDDIDPSKILDNCDDEGASARTARLVTRAAAKLVVAITSDVSKCPPMMRNILKYLHDQVTENFMGDSANPRSIVSGFLFLRFFVPAIVNPTKFGLLPEETVKAEAKVVSRARVWAVIGRIVQCLANGSVFPKKNNEAAAAAFNKFLRKNQRIISEFITSLASSS